MTDAPEQLVGRHGSPLFVLDGEHVERQWTALREALPDGVDVHYAVKANPALGVLALMRHLGAGADVASRGEMLAAEAGGFRAERIVFAGPGKTDDELREAAARDLLAIHVESERELDALDAIGRERGRPVAVGLRLHVPWSAGGQGGLIGGCSPAKFGIEHERALERAGEWARRAGLDVRGLHVFNCSNVLDARALAASAARTLELAGELARRGVPLRHVDLGGGLGVPHEDGETPLDVGELGRLLAPLVAAARERHGEEFRLLLEPGRYLLSESGRYLTRVVDVKRCGDVDFAVIDGGIHHLLRPALVGQPHRVRGPHRALGTRRRYRVVGPLCTGLDDFGEHVLPELRPGDVLAVENAGAYGFTEAMPAFLSHAVPAEVLAWRGGEWVLRPRREAEWHLEGQQVPAPLA